MTKEYPTAKSVVILKHITQDNQLMNGYVLVSKWKKVLCVRVGFQGVLKWSWRGNLEHFNDEHKNKLSYLPLVVGFGKVVTVVGRDVSEIKKSRFFIQNYHTFIFCWHFVQTRCTSLIGHVQHISSLTWLRGFRDKLLYLGFFSFLSKSLLGIERQKKL